jgi:hypothetical protein
MTEKTINLEIVDLEERIAPSSIAHAMAGAATDATAGVAGTADLGCATDGRATDGLDIAADHRP